MQGIKLKIPKISELEQPSSARMVVSIDDLLIEILLRVPIKSLVRFKTVSKRWLSIITNPQFSLLCHPNPNRAIGLFFPCSNYSLPTNPEYDYVHFEKKNREIPPFKNLKFIEDSSRISVLQSCNGLLLLCSKSRSRLAKGNCYYVCNPTTKDYTTLPKSVVETENSMIHGVSLAFDPAKSPHYKVVCVRDSVSTPQHFQIELYSSETGHWRLSGDPFIAYAAFHNGVYWNGSIHWISTFENLASLYYNLDFESFGVMPMPPLPDDERATTITYFGESCDHLHLIKFPFYTGRFDVFEMKRDYSEWFVKYKVDLEHYPYELNCYNFAIVSLVRGSREEDAFLVLAIPGDCKAMRYNLINKNFEKLCDYEGESKQVYLLGAFEYIESLCCV